jgi:glycosyltransferase involved in cell wall biosynthesis
MALTVSIVTPSFNQGRFLRRTVDSVLAQDYPDVEYLVIDGGSTDESRAILESYGKRFFWISEPDRGQTDALNKGFARARGDVLAYLNSDDVLLPGALRAIVGHFSRHADWDLVYGQAYHVDEHDAVLERYPTEPYDWGRLVQTCFICQPAAFWRRRLAERVGPFDERLQLAMDYDYWMRADRAGARIEHVPEYLACSRRHPQTKTLSARIGVYREIFEVSLRHAGAAGYGHYVAYWHHRLFERRDGWPRLLRRVPDATGWLATLHARWHRHRGQFLPWCGDLARSLAKKVVRGTDLNRR